MAGNFEIKIPITIKKKGGKEIGETIAEQIKKSLKSIGIGRREGISPATAGGATAGIGGLKMGAMVAGILAVLKSLDFIITPVMRLFKVVLMLLFIPLIPIFKKALIGMGEVVKGIRESSKRAPRLAISPEAGFIETFTKSIANFSGMLGQLVFDYIIEPIGNFIAKMIVDTGNFIADKIVATGEFIANLIIQGWSFMKNIGLFIWNNILEPAWNFLKDVGSLIWNIIKAPFVWLANKLKGLWNILKDAALSLVPSFLRKKSGVMNDFISRPGQVPVPFSSNDTIIGVKDPSKLGGGRSIVININNPIVRQSSDMKMLANEVSRVLQRQMTGRIATT